MTDSGKKMHVHECEVSIPCVSAELFVASRKAARNDLEHQEGLEVHTMSLLEVPNLAIWEPLSQIWIIAVEGLEAVYPIDFTSLRRSVTSLLQKKIWAPASWSVVSSADK